MSAYQLLHDRFKKIAALAGAQSILYWDLATMMPPGSADARSEQLAALQVVRHEILTAPEVQAMLEEATAETLDPWQSANLREMERLYREAAALPADLVEALTKACRRCEMEWRAARPRNDFPAVLPALKEVLHLVGQAASVRGEALGLAAYDALLNQYQPGLRRERLDALFAPLRRALPELIDAVLARQASRRASIAPRGPFPLARQEKLARRLMEQLGFSFERGRLDQSLHPFSGGTPDDLRITTRWDPADYATGLMGVLHETGHALYEAGLPRRWRHQPVGAARGMVLHESQSLLLEMQVCRSPAFLSFLSPLLAESFGADPAWEPENLFRLATRVERGLIRVDADEVTYPAHVLLRARLEPALLSGDLPLAELPGAWAEASRDLLGVVPPDDRRGCLQDIHWYDVAFGYFPTYSLGAMAAAQLYQAALAAEPEIEEEIERGEIGRLLAWLRREIHGKGCLLEWEELIAQATGQPLEPSFYLAHLRRRYLE